MRHRIAANKFGPRDYWWVSNSVIIKNKFSLLPVFTQFMVLTFSVDKLEYFVRKISLNPFLDSFGESVSNFPRSTGSPPNMCAL